MPAPAAPVSFPALVANLCKADVLRVARDSGAARAATVSDLIQRGVLTDAEWAACLALHRRKVGLS
jgi:hypothetical protein